MNGCNLARSGIIYVSKIENKWVSSSVLFQKYGNRATSSNGDEIWHANRDEYFFFNMAHMNDLNASTRRTLFGKAVVIKLARNGRFVSYARLDFRSGIQRSVGHHISRKSPRTFFCLSFCQQFSYFHIQVGVWEVLLPQ